MRIRETRKRGEKQSADPGIEFRELSRRESPQNLRACRFDLEVMAARLGVRRDYLAVLLRLSYLSPEIVRAILAGQHTVELTPTRLIALSRGLPHDWREQKRVLGFPLP